ncbi:alpha/beta fold hydrolase [Streptomyces spectabilis]|uniref:Alpha/beta hydrolase n=1 Tax=Streptomyces spectabilis TaxID=68270 RepID=A0A516R291_STRST|nr:alpha/beta hydrolase [Streptomyces spectabilis]QDQ09775.1 alpha/beta hydrolase [Streptomyces spectabilis]
MPTFPSYDGTKIAYHVSGDGPPLVCLPGGMRDSVYLGDLGGLSAHRRLIMLDLRGTGRSEVPADLGTCRCDRLAADVEALREHLGLASIDLLAHCAGANVAVQYASAHQDRVDTLTLITPSVLAVGIEISADVRLRTARLRADEPWFPEAYAALEAITAGRATDGSWEAVAPFLHGRWDEAAQALQAADAEQKNSEVVRAFGTEGAFSPAETRAALARFTAPVLLLTGEVDLNSPPPAMAELAALFPRAELVTQPGAGHHPWLDDAQRFVTTVTSFLN